MKVIRFIIAGGSAFSVNISLLYIFTEFLGLWYIFSATLAFLFSFLVGFSLNKFWTFANSSTDFIHNQILVYLGINLSNLIINNVLLYVMVESFGVWYILAQAIASIFLAFESFFLYRWLFRSKDPEVLPLP